MFVDRLILQQSSYDFYNISLILSLLFSYNLSDFFLFFSFLFFVSFRPILFASSIGIIHTATSLPFFLLFFCVTRPPNLRVSFSVLAAERSFQRGISTVPRPNIPKYVTYTS